MESAAGLDGRSERKDLLYRGRRIQSPPPATAKPSCRIREHRSDQGKPGGNRPQSGLLRRDSPSQGLPPLRTPAGHVGRSAQGPEAVGSPGRDRFQSDRPILTLQRALISAWARRPDRYCNAGNPSRRVRGSASGCALDRLGRHVSSALPKTTRPFARQRFACSCRSGRRQLSLNPPGFVREVADGQ